MARALLDALLYVGMAVFLLAFVIAAQAYRGYRRNDSRPMVYLAAGFALIGANPFVGIVLARLVGAGRDLYYVTVGAGVLVLGAAFSSIPYALYRLT